MEQKLASAQPTITTIQSNVFYLQAADYNTNHSILNGYNVQLKATHDTLVKARADAVNAKEALQTLNKQQ